MAILWVLLVGVTSTLLFYKFSDKREYHWLEVVSQFMLVFLVAFGVIKLGQHFRGSDTEYWGDLLTEIVYEGVYEEWEYNSCCTTYECNCTTDKDGTETCSSCCEGCWECNKYGPKIKKVGISGREYYGVSGPEYKRVVKSLGFKSDYPDEEATQRRHSSLDQAPHCDRDDGIRHAEWNDSVNTAENIVTEHSYENKVRYSNSVYGYDKPTESFSKSLGLVDYHPVRSYYQPDIQGPLASGMEGYEMASRKLALLNGSLGKAKQLKVMIFVLRDTLDVIFWQKQYLEGGNKNEFILAVSLDKSGDIADFGVITWTEEYACINLVKNWMQEYTGKDLNEIVDNISPMITQNWKRREFTPLNEFVNLTPPIWAIVLAIIIQIAAGFGLFHLFSSNNFRPNA